MLTLQTEYIPLKMFVKLRSLQQLLAIPNLIDRCYVLSAGGVVVSFRLPTQEVGGSIPVSTSPREVR